MSYPSHLLPQPAFCPLSAPYPAQALLLRRTEPTDTFYNEAGEFIADLLTEPRLPRTLADGYSTNLAGTFSIQDLGWRVVKGGERSEALNGKWRQGDEPEVPNVPEDMRHTTMPEWNFFWLVLDEIHNQEFKGSGHPYRCEVRHCPTRCNYWHYQIHFIDLQTSPATDTALFPKHYGRVAERVRPWLLERIKAVKAGESLPTLTAWQRAWHCPSC